VSSAVETRGKQAEDPGAGAGAKEAFVPGEEPPAPFGSLATPGAATNATEVYASAEPTAKIHRHSLLQAFQSLVYLIVIALFIIAFTVQPFKIPSASMEPTLLVGDFLLVNKEVSSGPGVFAPTSRIHRGDLIVFHYPVDASMHLVKRVIGLPGERLRLREGHVYINGQLLAEPYAVFRPSAPDSYRDDFPHLTSADPGVDSRWWIQMRSLVEGGELTIPAGSYFVLGDNRNDSEDSRYWGFVPRAAIVGKPFLIYFSLRDRGGASGELAAANGDRRDAALGALADFARWNRALRIVH
jgi:signal peptidase I